MKKQLIWLTSLLFLITLIVIVGGITRLTGSGLSMVDWQPIAGILPPLSETQWLDVFNQYKNFPEYQHLYPDMTLEGFKKIFFWEYFHRILGRIIGLAIIIPYFMLTLSDELKKRGKVMIVLVIVQGLMGWFMVKSGLVDNPHVSHYRLAAHLGLAFFLMQYILWTILQLILPNKTNKHPLFTHIHIITMLIGIQILYGAFVAGLDAGLGFNTWPKMGDYWLPPTAWHLTPLIKNIFENPVMVQFIHRTLGILLTLLIIALPIKAKSLTLSLHQKRSLKLLITATLIQFILGIKTLLFMVPLSLAVLHQLGALVLLSVCTYAMYVFKKSEV